ncbi:ABC transporter permease [Gynuella sunshinyii]|uniref:ABC-type arginine transport system, permease component n=1 Tax=Gynuella sunshinyii YC6258 TaxID=1445510 RepID=A0A0C5VT89_9GAMM|nr:ABC transporter permease [Gynuella sunshinyii]AJQ93534.1 ABC-type arginine transport system, permease component [Gynuella sunshinyii YC6258]
MFDFHGYGLSIFKGAFLTMEVAVLSMMMAVLLGLVGALAKLSNKRSLRIIATVYTTVIRGVPDLVLMLLIFFGAQIIVNKVVIWYNVQFGTRHFIDIDAFLTGVLTIGFIFGAYMAETFRGAYMSVSKGQIEAAVAYGMSRWRIFIRILFPQMMRFALPGLGNNWMVLLKTTALVSVIGLSDMVRLAKEASGAVHEPFKFFIPVVIVYLAITFISEILLSYLKRKFSVGFVKG